MPCGDGAIERGLALPTALHSRANHCRADAARIGRPQCRAKFDYRQFHAGVKSRSGRGDAAQRVRIRAGRDGGVTMR